MSMMLLLFLLLLLHLQRLIILRVFLLQFRVSFPPSRATWRAIRHSFSFAVKPVSSLISVVISVVGVELLPVHLNCRTSLVLSMNVSVHLSVVRWPIIAHWNVVCSRSHVSDRRCVILLSVGVTRLGHTTFVAHWVTVIQVLVLHLSLLLHFPKSLIQRVFTMTRYVFIVFGFVNIS